MTNTPAKLEPMIEWQALLDDETARKDLALWHSQLLDRAATMQAAGAIDDGEARELRELADAAFSHWSDTE
jgi:hypothetical protein